MTHLLRLAKPLLILTSLVCLVSVHFAHGLPTPSQDTFRGERLAVDIGSRVQTSAPSDLYSSMSFLGLDFYSFLHFGGKHRGDLVAQIYLFNFVPISLNNNTSAAGPSFDYAPCVIAPNLILIPQGKLNLKFGHIWHGYGLRNEINTTQTLRQMISMENTGLLLDWGVELNGELNSFSYNISLGTGSGKWPSFSGKQHMGVARLALNGQHFSHNWFPVELGLSGLSTRVNTAQGIVDRWRAGLDVQYHGAISVLFEGSIGSDQSVNLSNPSSRQALNLFTEVNWHSPSETWFIYLQHRSLMLELDRSPSSPDSSIMEDSQDLMESTMMLNMANSIHPKDQLNSGTLGIRYSPLRNLYIASEVAIIQGDTHPLSRLQLRYRW